MTGLRIAIALAFLAATPAAHTQTSAAEPAPCAFTMQSPAAHSNATVATTAHWSR
ncbi:MAG: hypothetical protein AAF914_09665 [Pseudomonadota bacterium]